MTEDLLLKIILKEMPNHHPWCADDWDENEDETLTNVFNRFLFNEDDLRNDLIKFFKMFIGNTATPFGHHMSAHLANKIQDCRDFADVVLSKYKAYQMVDTDLHDVLDI
jgi:hypothetical protein